MRIYNLVDLCIGTVVGSLVSSNSWLLGCVAWKNLLNCAPPKLISSYKKLNFSKAIQLAYRLLMFSLDFLPWKVVKIEWLGSRSHFL